MGYILGSAIIGIFILGITIGKKDERRHTIKHGNIRRIEKRTS